MITEELIGQFMSEFMVNYMFVFMGEFTGETHPNLPGDDVALI